MSNFLRIHGKRVPLDATEKWLQDELGQLIQTSLDAFLAIARDNDRKTRLLILDAVEAGIVNKEGRKYFLTRWRAIGVTRRSTINGNSC